MERFIRFTKMSGAGNDFVIIDNMDESLAVDKTKLARAVCSRHFGIGADGLLLLEPSAKADFFMRYYNADGSYGGMCGNGGRCIARYAYLNGYASDRLTFEALDFLYTAEIVGGVVRLQMKPPADFRFDVAVPTSAGTFTGHFVNTGSPHFVCEAGEMDADDVQKVGREIRFNEIFQPEGCNVNFITRSRNALSIRTYERGVEAETLACGTGSVAAALIAASLYHLPSPIQLNVRSGEELKVHFQKQEDAFVHVVLEGSAHFVFAGTCVYDTESGALVDFSEQPSAVRA